VKWVGYAAAASAAWFALNFSGVRDYFKARAIRNDNRRAVAQLQERHERLQQEKRELDRLGFSAEEALRERFKKKLEGEHIIDLHEDSGPDPAMPSPEN
jgi:hypothetical protein